MTPLPRWPVLALSLAVAACGGGGGGGGGGGTGDACAWFTAANCWKTAAAAATACTSGTALGTFNGATTACTYGDGTSVQFDPSASATASYWQDVPWDFTVVSTTTPSCARYWEDGTSMNLTVAGLGTFSESWTSGSLVISCPGGGGGITMDVQTALNSLSSCASDMPGWYTSGPSPYGGSGPITFGLMGTATGDTVLWRCQ